MCEDRERSILDIKLEPKYEGIRRTMTGKGLEEMETIRGVGEVQLRLLKQIYKKRIEYTVKACVNLDVNDEA